MLWLIGIVAVAIIAWMISWWLFAIVMLVFVVWIVQGFRSIAEDYNNHYNMR